MCDALIGLPLLVERHLRDWCLLFSSRREQVYLSSREPSPAPCAGQLWVARSRRGEEVRNRDIRSSRKNEVGWIRREVGESERKRPREKDQEIRHKEWMCENKSKRPTSVTHYPPGPLSTNRSIWHHSRQTSLWLQMGLGRRGIQVIQGKGTKVRLNINAMYCTMGHSLCDSLWHLLK